MRTAPSCRRNPFRGDLVGHKLRNPKLLEEIRRPENPSARTEPDWRPNAASISTSRIIASRQISSLPLYVAVGLAEQDVLAEWRESLNNHVAHDRRRSC